LFFAWAYRVERLATNPAARLEGRRCEDRLPRPLAAPDIARILAATPAAKLRDQNALHPIARHRHSRWETLSLQRESVSLDDGDERARVLGKGGHERTVLLHVAFNTMRLLRRL